MIEAQTSFGNFFETSNDSPYYIYKQNPTEASFVIYIDDASVDQSYLINIKYEEVELPTTDAATTGATTTTSDGTTNIPVTQSASGSFFNNEIIFAKSLNAASDKFCLSKSDKIGIFKDSKRGIKSSL